MTIGNRISELRKKSTYSQEYVASELGVTRQAVSKWETDQTSPDTNNLIALAQLFGVSVEYLATGKTAETEIPHEDRIAINGTRKIIGYILLGVGLLTLVLGFVIFEELLFLAVAFILGGVLCLALKKHFGIITAWVYTILVGIFGSFFTGLGIMWLSPKQLAEGWSGTSIFTALFTLWNTVLLVLTAVIVAKVIKKVLHK